MRWAGAVLVAAGAVLLFSTSTFAGFIFNAGTLNASASASDRSGSASFTATPVSVPNAAGATISATVKSPDPFMFTTGGASTTFSMLEWTGQQPRFSPAIRILGSTQAEKLDGSAESPSSGRVGQRDHQLHRNRHRDVQRFVSFRGQLDLGTCHN
jgi:hypothetical protein